MKKEIVNTTQAPAPIGPYNQSVKFGNMLFVSGQIPYDEANKQLINTGISDETHQVMKNIGYILHESGFTFDDVVKATISIKDMEDFSAINEVYAQYFNPDTAPARECVQVARLPRDVNIEISVICGK